MALIYDQTTLQLLNDCFLDYCHSLKISEAQFTLTSVPGQPNLHWTDHSIAQKRAAREQFTTESLQGFVTVWADESSAVDLARGLVVLLQREVTALSRQQRLQTSHDQLSAVVQTAPLGLYSLTLEGLVKCWNTTASTVLGLPVSDPSKPAVLPDAQLGAAFQALRENTAVQGQSQQHVERVQLDGSARSLELTASPMLGHPDGQALVGVAREMTVSEQQLLHAERQRSLLESVLAFANDSVLITEAEPLDAPGPRILYANEAFTRTTGYTLEDVLGQSPRILQGPKTDREALKKLKAALKAWQPIEIELVNHRKDGSAFWVELSIAPVADANGWYTHWISIQRDVTERKLSALQLERTRNEVLELAARNVALPDVLTRLLNLVENEFAQAQVAILLSEPGTEQPELYLQSGEALKSPWVTPQNLDVMLRDTAKKPVSLHTADRSAQWTAHVERLTRSQGNARGVIALVTSSPEPLQADDEFRLTAATQLVNLVIDRYDVQRDLEYQALHDSLTGLPNRLQFSRDLELGMQRFQEGQLHVVGLIDLDRFKLVNDTFGHGAGDRLLQEVAGRLSKILRPQDRLARMGGDEFLFMFAGLSSEAQVEQRSAQILQVLEQPFMVQGQEIFIRPSLGLSLPLKVGQTPEEMLQQADTAMYVAKRRGGGLARFTPEMSKGAAPITLESALNRALERDEFVLHYQPQFDLQTSELVGVEALLRWQHTELGLVPPNDFIPLAEMTGLIVPIGRWVLEQASRQMAIWSALRPRLKMAVNVSARQFTDQHFLEDVAGILKCSGLPAHQLELELTESLLMQAAEATGMLKRLKTLGVKIAVDDFGTGYSNLAYLSRFPIDLLKIDRSFVQVIAQGSPMATRDEALLNAMIGLAHALDMKVIAEGVEEQGQHDFLKSRGCDQVQGYLLGRPQPAEMITALLSAQLESGLAVERI
ncbi:bifunctional diguanylate cyclase/phosphodiesterase [Deinococcus alpinitundrae]|uniref:bifunctional diguanylate cyclase/phosphodiesterase n=1 Tax=Deinococcus alpinitundrae TaxID=468913 RepID=UPI00137B6702|nr:EAL domain-containing protein [Deinococcus alpinitundrae]